MITSSRTSAMRRRGGAAIALSTVLAVATAAGTGAAALAAPHGRLVQPSGPAGCIHPKPIAGCARARAINGPGSVALSPDGRNAYVASFNSHAVAVFRRDRRTGALRQLPGKLGCVSHHGAGACGFGRALRAPISVAVSPDGRNVYVAATGSDALSVFARNPRTGAIRQLVGMRGCISNFVGGGCVRGRALNEPIAVEVSRDGRRVYVAARENPSAVSVFARARDGSLAQAAGPGGCVSQDGRGGCTAARAMAAPWDIEVSSDSRNVYVAGSDSDSVAVLTRTPGGLAQRADASGCVNPTSDEGCARIRALRTPTGVALSPDGTTLYASGVDSDTVAILHRDRVSGALSQSPGAAACVGQSGAAGCKPARVLDGVHDAVVSPDGRNLYTVSEDIDAMSVFARRADGSLSQLPGRWACFIKGGVLGCGLGRGLSPAIGVTASRDGRSVYTDSYGALGIFRRLR